MVHPGGRPREHDRSKIAQDMILWARKEDSLNLNGFCADCLIPPQKLSEWAKEDSEFREVLWVVKSFLARRREKCVSEGTLHQKAYDLNAKVYDALIKEEHREQLAYEMQLKAQQIDAVTEDQKVHLKQLFDMFNAQSDLNIDDKSKIKDAKS